MSEVPQKGGRRWHENIDTPEDPQKTRTRHGWEEHSGDKEKEINCRRNEDVKRRSTLVVLPQVPPVLIFPSGEENRGGLHRLGESYA